MRNQVVELRSAGSAGSEVMVVFQLSVRIVFAGTSQQVRYKMDLSGHPVSALLLKLPAPNLYSGL